MTAVGVYKISREYFTAPAAASLAIHDDAVTDAAVVPDAEAAVTAGEADAVTAAVDTDASTVVAPASVSHRVFQFLDRHLTCRNVLLVSLGCKDRPGAAMCCLSAASVPNVRVSYCVSGLSVERL